MFDVIKETLISEKEFTETTYKRLTLKRLRVVNLIPLVVFSNFIS